MDWNAAIERNREALKRVLAMLVGMAALPVLRACGDAGIAGGGATLPRHLHRAVLRLLRPAEAAARRLIIVAARGVVALPPVRPRKPEPASPQARNTKTAQSILRNGVGTGIVMPPNFRPKAGTPAARLCLPLTDPLRRWGGRGRPAASGVPRISIPGLTEPFPVVVRRPPSPDDPIDAARLNLRLRALGRALDDLPREARRFARWRRRTAVGVQNGESRDAAGTQNIKLRDAAGAQNKETHGSGPFRRIWPLRPGRPPGWCRSPIHEVHEVLNVAHGLAIWALESPDTS